MERAAAREHGWLRLLHGTFARRWLNLAARADAAIAAAGDGRYAAAKDGSGRDGMSLAHGEDATGADATTYGALLGQFRDELAQWTGDSGSGSGIPRAALGPRPAKPHPPVRDLTLGGSEPLVLAGLAGTGRDAPEWPGADRGVQGSAARGAAHPGDGPRERFERHPQLMMLFTNRDEPADWLRAGQALQRALLTATSLGASASFLTQPLEIADLEFRSDPRVPSAARPDKSSRSVRAPARRRVPAQFQQPHGPPRLCPPAPAGGHAVAGGPANGDPCRLPREPGRERPPHSAPGTRDHRRPQRSARAPRVASRRVAVPRQVAVPAG